MKLAEFDFNFIVVIHRKDLVIRSVIHMVLVPGL